METIDMNREDFEKLANEYAVTILNKLYKRIAKDAGHMGSDKILAVTLKQIEWHFNQTKKAIKKT